MPHILGDYEALTKHNVTWEQIAEHSEIVLAFGGMALKNSEVAGGGISQHIERGAMRARAARGCEFVLVGPLRDDLPAEAGAEWISIIPGTDTALMLALAHTLVTEGCTTALFSTATPWAGRSSSAISWARPTASRRTLRGPPPSPAFRPTTIAALARRLHGRRALVVVSHSLQRAEHGEQPVWMGAVLAAVLGQIGLPGGGYGYALGAIGYYGRRNNAVPHAHPAAGPQRCLRLHPGRAHRRHAAATRAASIATTARRGPIPTSAWSTGPAATRSTTTRTSTGLRAAFARWIRWSCTSSPGPPLRATPISSCPAP